MPTTPPDRRVDPPRHGDDDMLLPQPSPTGTRLAGLHAFVTGASRGIGRAIAVAMAREGAALTLAATRRPLLEQVAAECAAPGGPTHRVRVLDVTDRADCFEAIREAEREAGRVDVLVNAAGIWRGARFLDLGEEDFRELFDVNLMGTVHLMQAALPGMIARRSGRIVNVASTAGKYASANQAAYNVSKHAVVGLTRCVALENGEHGVTVNAICPGFVQTDMLTEGIGGAARAAGRTLDEAIGPVLARVAMKRVLQPDEVAGLAVYLASPESRGMTGQSIAIDGGMVYV
jgi:NAD(P)-dependent dehydrogenase (short-subunit alcohol dehydrogenase family)